MSDNEPYDIGGCTIMPYDRARVYSITEEGSIRIAQTDSVITLVPLLVTDDAGNELVRVDHDGTVHGTDEACRNALRNISLFVANGYK